MNTDFTHFRRWAPEDTALAAAARVAVAEVLRVNERERVLIVTNPQPEVFAISQALYDAVVDAGGTPVLSVQQVKTQLSFSEDAVVAAIGSAPDVLISMSAEKIGKDRRAIANPFTHDGKSFDSTFHYLLYGVKTMRAFWSPHVDRGMFIKTVPINYPRLQHEASLVKRILDEAVEVHIATKAGTNLTIGLRNREAKADDGYFSLPGTGGNLPAGESFISPELATARGSIVFDASLSVHDDDIVLRNPIRLTVEQGFVTEIDGDAEAGRLRETIRLGEEHAIALEQEGTLPAGLGPIYSRNARGLGELGIGLNPKAEIVGNMLEDEKAYRTCHIAIGSNYDEDAPALIHLDGLIREPTITAFFADGRKNTFMKSGELVL